MQRITMILPLVLGLAAAQNMVVNGDFEQDFSVGWTQNQVGAGTHTFDRGTGYDPDPDYEAFVRQYSGAGSTSLDQTFTVSDLNLDFSFDAKMNVGNGSSTCWGAAAIIVGYYDRDGAYQGDTRFYYHDAYCTWISTGTMHLYEVPNTGWNSFRMNVLEELTQNLPEVPQRLVKKVRVSVYTGTSGS